MRSKVQGINSLFQSTSCLFCIANTFCIAKPFIDIIQGSHWLLVNNNIFQGYILSNSLIYIHLVLSQNYERLYKISKNVEIVKMLPPNQIQGLFKDSILTKFKDFQGLENEPIFFKDFQSFLRMWELCYQHYYLQHLSILF